MKIVLLLSLLFLEFAVRTGSLVVRSGGKNAYNTKMLKTVLHLEAAVRLIRANPCINSQSGSSCSRIPQVPKHEMNVYVATKSHPNEKLIARLPDRKYRSLVPNDRNIDSVLAIDPYPQASFGHLVYIFFVKENANPLNYTKNNISILTASGDCVIAATKTHCKNALSERKRKKCYIDFLPLVFAAGDPSKTQKLGCKDNLSGFGKCRLVPATPRVQCANSPRCANVPRSPPMTCLYKRCDYAVLVSGSWNPLTAHPRHAKNVQLFWKFLRENQFKKEHITTFYGSDGTIELDGDLKTTRDASAAVTDVGVTDYIGKLCKARLCVDTLVLYLTGLAKSNGALLMWDVNEDGLTENKEMFTIHEIFKQLRDCNAERVFIIADYSYSGQLAHKLRDLSRHRHRDAYKHITVLASSQTNGYSWGNEFTEAVIKHGKQNKTRCIHQLFQDVKTNFWNRQLRSTPTFTEGSPNSGNFTVYGGRCDQSWSEASSTAMGCKVIPVTEHSKLSLKSRRKNKSNT